MNLPFHIVDVFSDSKYAGNQLAVVRNATALEKSQMQKIARETNFSETTFIMVPEPFSSSGAEEKFSVRIFTPTSELPFAGHPTIGTAFVIQKYLLKHPVPKITLSLGVGPIDVTIDYEKNGEANLLWMKQNEPRFEKVDSSRVPAIAQVLGLDVTEIDANYPLQEVSTGLPTYIVPLKFLDSLKRCQVDRRKCLEFVAQIEAKNILVFAPGSHGTKSKLSVRVFVEYYGIPEDPATGSGNGCLAAYLAKHKYFGAEKIDIQVDQGYEMGRPSTLFLRTNPENGKLNVSVGGRVVPVVEGTLL